MLVMRCQPAARRLVLARPVAVDRMLRQFRAPPYTNLKQRTKLPARGRGRPFHEQARG